MPSFKLSKRGKVWIATGTVPGAKKPFKFECGDGSEGAAKKIADAEVKRRAQLVEASRIRWRKFHAEKAKAAAAAPASKPADDDELPDDLDDQLEQQEESDATPVERPIETPPQARNADELRAKLLGIGDSGIEPDEVIPPGAGASAAEDQEDPLDDDETPELIANIVAGGVVNWHTRRITKMLKARKPPRRPGEPHERMLAWEHDGIAYNMKKLVGRSAALGPTGKMLVGFTIVTAQMLLESEIIDGEPAAEEPRTAASAAPADEQARGNANGSHTDAPTLALVKPNPGVGKFK